MKQPFVFLINLIFSLFFLIPPTLAQEVDGDKVKEMITRFKNDPRGPYIDIRWFCKDGTVREARDPCPGIGEGRQHARYKEEVIRLADRDHIFIGQILATTPKADFWDDDHAQSRLKQYQLETYLRNIDDGWVNRKAQFYRGAMQVEDEIEWGMEFYQWLLSDADNIRQHFFLIRQSLQDIPHTAESNTAQQVRALATDIAEAFPSFQDLRIKIHGSPDAEDSGRVWDFQDKNKAKIDEPLARKFDQLVCGLEKMFSPFRVSDFNAYINQLPKGETKNTITHFTNIYPTMDCPPDQCRLISETALMIRHDIVQPMSSSARLAMLDISNKLEDLLLSEFSKWKIEYLSELLDQVHTLSAAATAFGFLEMWEWEEIKTALPEPVIGSTITLQQLNTYNENARKVTEWSTAMVRSVYMPVIDIFSEFEPLAPGFYDDVIRSSVLLHLGNTTSHLGDEFSIKAGLSHDVPDIRDPSSIRGLNPGFTMGELVVVTGPADAVEISPDKIYIFHKPPSDLKPVAGIATVTEGNMVSHIQLLARNLGIPNAVISSRNMDDIKKYNGKEVFYAVSPKGIVVLKPASKMNARERKLFEKKARSEEKIVVPVEKIQLYNPGIIDMKTINASHSGRISGPKAANLGQLKQMFPEYVVEGIVLPFAVFRQHMNQTIPGQEISYWAMIIGTFDHAECMRCSNATDVEVETYILGRLDTLRFLIKKMPLLPSFKKELREKFIDVFGNPMGKVPVFVRSDTNMEDLKDFTGAGLNLTVFNVVDPEKIYQGIRDVWASPYTERSYKWRQLYLLNPENVFPSIVIIPSVDGDHSGVIVTQGVTTGDETDLTVAFNRGVGGAVDGQSAETWLLKSNGTNVLISPARESTYRTIPAAGGSVTKKTTFEKRILSPAQLEALRAIVQKIKEELPKAEGISSNGPWDIELGFKDDKIWLFQVRPFVENKQAAASEYLQQISPDFNENKTMVL